MFLAPGLRARLVVPGVLVLVGALLAGSAFQVAAKDGEPDDLPKYSACVGSALKSAGFRDLKGYYDEAVDAINCLAHYRITEGTSRWSFSPNDPVTRGQMAVFLVRAAVPAGIDLPRPSGQGFTDIGRLPSEFWNAINQLAELEITTGKTATTYAPDATVTRRQMANFLYRFLDLVPVGPGGVDIEDVDPDDERFEDIGVLPIADHRAVRVLYEMGIIKGTSPSRFSPGEYVSRAQMASFIIRMLAHTNARPAGLTLQTEDTTVTERSTAEIMVSVRDRNRQPVPDSSIDLFHAAPDAEAFEDGGYCDDDKVILVSGRRLCEIDLDDETTDEDGNLVYDVVIDEGLILWAWTGGLRDDFDVDRTDYDSLLFATKKGPFAFEMTDDMAAGARVLQFGNSVTFTFQLVDDEGDPVYQEDVEIKVRSVENDGEVLRPRTRDTATNESGQAHLTFRISRPRSVGDDEKVYLSLEILNSSGYRVIDKTTTMVRDRNGRLAWGNADGEPTTIVLEQRADYRFATSEGSGATNSIVATFVDQYGDPVRGETIHFVSNDPYGLDRDDDPTMAKPDYRKETNRRGEAVVRYNRDYNQPGIEEISARAFIGDRTVETDPLEPLEHYWVKELPEDRTLYLEVLIHNEDLNTLVLGGSGQGPWVVTYDPHDQFNLDGAREKFDSFSEGLEEGHYVEVRIKGHDQSEVNSFTRYD